MEENCTKENLREKYRSLEHKTTSLIILINFCLGFQKDKILKRTK